MPGWTSGQRLGPRSLLDSPLDPAQAKNVHSGCSVWLTVTNRVYEKHQERCNSPNVTKMKVNKDMAKNESSNVLMVIKQIVWFFVMVDTVS